MGGTGTASTSDASAVYYNPSGLSKCPSNQASAEINYLAYDLPVESETEELQALPLENRAAFTVSACLQLPYKLSAGFLFDVGLGNAQRLQQTSLATTPEFALYGKPLEQISMMAGSSYQVSDALSIGVGGALLVNSGLQVSAAVPILSADSEIEGAVAWTLEPAIALYGGATYNIGNSLTLGASFRTALYHKLQAEAKTRVEAAGVLIDVDLLLEHVAWYSPLQASVGAAFTPSEKLTIAFDATWYHWSAYPGPFIQITPLDEMDSVATGLNYPPQELPNFSDIIVPSLGIEYLLTSEWIVRTGLRYKPTPASLPAADARSNLLDSDVGTLSLGAGYLWKEVSSKSSKGVQTIAIDFHARVHRMNRLTVPKAVNGESTSFRFGGTMTDFGFTATTRW